MSEGQLSPQPTPPFRPTSIRASGTPHGLIFCTLLVIFALAHLLHIPWLWTTLKNPANNSLARGLLKSFIVAYAIGVTVVVGSLIARALLPASRRNVTVAVSIVLLLWFPFGSAIGIYGLWKVDRQAGR